MADVHGNFEALARAGDGADLLLILGDLLDYVDYHDPSGGILGAVFGAERVRPFTALRTRGDFPGLHAYNQQLWAGVPDPAGAIEDIVAQRYRRVVEVVPEHTWLLLGNVDVASTWSAVAPPRLRGLDAETRTLAGVRFGFVAGGSGRPGAVIRQGASPWRPFVRSADDFQAAVDSLGPVDVLCSHVPPQLTPMRYDTVPARLEMYGPGLVEYIDRFQPKLALSGHVHQPLSRRLRRGRTECVNVGHFQRSGRPYVLDL